MIKSHYGNFWIQPKYHVMENHTMENHVIQGITVLPICSEWCSDTVAFVTFVQQGLLMKALLKACMSCLNTI